VYSNWSLSTTRSGATVAVYDVCKSKTTAADVTKLGNSYLEKLWSGSYFGSWGQRPRSQPECVRQTVCLFK